MMRKKALRLQIQNPGRAGTSLSSLLPESHVDDGPGVGFFGNKRQRIGGSPPSTESSTDGEVESRDDETGDSSRGARRSGCGGGSGVNRSLVAFSPRGDNQECDDGSMEIATRGGFPHSIAASNSGVGDEWWDGLVVHDRSSMISSFRNYSPRRFGDQATSYSTCSDNESLVSTGDRWSRGQVYFPGHVAIHESPPATTRGRTETTERRERMMAGRQGGEHRNQVHDGANNEFTVNHHPLPDTTIQQFPSRRYHGIGSRYDNYDDNVPTKTGQQDDDDDDDESTKTGQQDDGFPSSDIEFSDDDSFGHVNQLFRENVIPIDVPIIESFSRPKVSYVSTPTYSYNEQTAPKYRDTVITYEEMGGSETNPPKLHPEPLESRKIESLFSFSKGTKGIMWHNRTSSKLHYETTSDTFENTIRLPALQKGIKHRIFTGETNGNHCVRCGDKNVTILAIGKEEAFKKFHSKVCFQQVIRDACIPSDNLIAEEDSRRQNHGVSVGLASSQGTTVTGDDGIAEPHFMKGTKRYAKVFAIISETTQMLLRHHGLQNEFSYLLKKKDAEKLPPKEVDYVKKCREIHAENMYLSLSFKVYLHKPPNIKNYHHCFHVHRDEQNPHFDSPYDIAFTAWESWFEPRLQSHLTATMIACGRRSQYE